MKMSKTSRRDGSILSTVVLYTAIASITIGSILTAVAHYMQYNRFTYRHERSFFLAEAGLTAAIEELRNGGDGIISLTDSKLYFDNIGVFEGTNWGFTTTATSLGNGRIRVSSVGEHIDSNATVTGETAEQVSVAALHALYSLAIYAGNSSGNTNYMLTVGGTGAGADFVDGDVHINGDIGLSGHADLRHPEGYTDADGDSEFGYGEDYTESGTLHVFTNAITAAELATYEASLSPDDLYSNGTYDEGEAFVDTQGNGVYDAGENFVDNDGDGVYGFGDTFVDADGDGVYDPGEEFVDRGNGQYDLGEEFEDVNGNGVWDDATAGYSTGSGWNQTWVDGTDAEPYEDLGNGSFDSGESFVDLNGTYDEGESFVDDRNGTYDYGTTATGALTGMPSPAAGQATADGNDASIAPPNLTNMYYATSNSNATPAGAQTGWGFDVDVAAGSFDGDGEITDATDPRHIFVKNPNNRTYTSIAGKDDYFLEDPTDASYGDSHQFLTVNDNGKDKVYYVDGNLYIHNPNSYDFMFRDPGVKITIVASGNITISDEFFYNGGTSNPQDALALIAMKDPNEPNSGNIFLGDAQFGTGGEVHSMLYAENNFVDNNLGTSGQPYLSVFGNMSAGNHVDISRGTGSARTRLDVTLDERIRAGLDVPPGLPGSQVGQRSVGTVSSNDWTMVSGTWSSGSQL